MRALLITFLLLSSMLFAESVKTPKVEQLSDTCYKLGEILIDSATRCIQLPAFVEQNEVLVEYLLVSTHGKVHESVFLTRVNPLELNIALKLIGLKESKELLQILDKNYQPTGKYYQATAPQKQHSRLTITASWESQGKTVTYPVHRLINHASRKQTMAEASWIYSGSILEDENFLASSRGDMIAIYTDPIALINYAGDGRNDDMVWTPNKAKLPPLGSPVTLTLTKVKR